MNLYSVKLLLIGVLVCFISHAKYVVHDKATLIIFSYDRPLQLYALLESTERYVSGIETAYVIYRTSTDAFDSAYNQVKKDFPQYIYVKQSVGAANDFKELLERCLDACNTAHLIFAVDDIIVTDYVNLTDCIHALEDNNAYAFYLRLGKNLSYCHPMNAQQPVPPLHHVGSDVMSWQLSKGKYDWGYPNNVDLTLYRTADIVPVIKTLQYHSPNTLEGRWDYSGQDAIHRQGLCYRQSKMVNIPCNRVQNDCLNRYNTTNLALVTAHDLLALFADGYKINIAPFYKISNNAAHQEYIFECVRRDNG